MTITLSWICAVHQYSTLRGSFRLEVQTLDVMATFLYPLEKDQRKENRTSARQHEAE